MKRLFFGLSFAAMALFVACGGDSGSSADSLDESSSSSEMDGTESSDSVNPSSSDQVTLSSDSEDLNPSGSEGGKSSGSVEGTSSDSSEGNSSGSSEEPESCNSEGVEGSSASVPGGSSDASIYNASANTLTDLRDGQTYNTVTIGTQTWMAENLNYAYTGVPYNYNGYTSDSTSWCYGDAPANCAKYGRLYTWAAAMDSLGTWSTNGRGCGYGKTCNVASTSSTGSPTGSATLVRGICPKGWHLPSRTEWEALFTAVGGSSTAGTKLKSQTGWTAYSGITNEDAFGFSALPAGDRYSTGYFYNEGDDAYFWSSTKYSSSGAYNMRLGYLSDNGYLDYNFKGNGLSVRCLRD